MLAVAFILLVLVSVGQLKRRGLIEPGHKQRERDTGNRQPKSKVAYLFTVLR